MMNCIVTPYIHTSRRLFKGARIALTNRLHLPEGDFRSRLEDIRTFYGAHKRTILELYGYERTVHRVKISDVPKTEQEIRDRGNYPFLIRPFWVVGLKGIFIAYMENEVVGCGIYCTGCKNSKYVQLFVADEYRRRGVGTEIIRCIKHTFNVGNTKVFGAYHTEEAKGFFSTVGVDEYHPW